MAELQHDYKCETCDEVFKEDSIFYKCKECNNYYCFICFCRNHYDKHKTGWIEYKIKNGTPIGLGDPNGPMNVK